MDDRRFDNLTRTIGSAITRRGALGVVIGTWIGLGRRQASARMCRLVGEPCGKGAKNRCCAGANCNEDQVGGGICTCPQSLTNCHGLCVDIANNPLACGENCAVCAEDTDCCDGICCKDGQRCCEGKCTDLTSDNDHCGSCTQVCPKGLTCCDSRCRAFDDDPRHCGGCGKQCGIHATCVNGQCVCRKGYGDCGDGVCRFLQTDPQNCGRCGRVCGRGQRCVRGRCKCAPGSPTLCLPGENRCGGGGDRPCASDEECCGGACIRYGGQRRCRPCLGRPCLEDTQCCDGLSCFQSPGPAEFAHFCGGCRGRREACSMNEQCCFTDCTPDARGSTCLSNRDGRCLSDLDCRDCFVNGNCGDACVGGHCRA